MDMVKNLTVGQLKENAPDVTIGATVKVHVKIREGEKSRTQIFEGIIIAVNGSGIAKTFTVRKIAYGVGIERVFPVHSPNVEKVEVVSYGKTRRSKLYYLRDRVGKAAKLKQKLK